MTIDDIKALIAAYESRTLELKKSTGELKDGIDFCFKHLSLSGRISSNYLIFRI